MTTNFIIEQMGAFPMFRGLSDRELHEVAFTAEQFEGAAGDFLFPSALLRPARILPALPGPLLPMSPKGLRPGSRR